MKKVLFLVVVCAVGWTVFARYQRAGHFVEGRPEWTGAPLPVASELQADGEFTCDGRTYCSQMTSCAEATYFLRHCPNTKMDGNGDGVPCERQWCRR